MIVSVMSISIVALETTVRTAPPATAQRSQEGQASSEKANDISEKYSPTKIKSLGMERSLIRYQGGGHGAATSGNPCMGGVIAAYLFNLTVPDEGFSCPGRADRLYAASIAGKHEPRLYQI